MVTRSIQKRITSTLFVSQSLFNAAAIMSFTLMPIISAHLGGSDAAAGIPPTVVMLGRALAAYPVGWLMDQVGRRWGLCIGYLLATLGAILCVLSVHPWTSFIGFSLGGLLMGMGRGVVEQTRFIAAEVYPQEQQAKIIGLIVFAGTLGAIGGPLLVDPSGHLAIASGMHIYAGPYAMSAAFTALSLLLVFVFLRPDPMTLGQTLVEPSHSDATTSRSLKHIFAIRSVRLGVMSMVIGQLVMTLIMVITPLHMNHHAHNAKAISWVIMAHTLGMFGLSSVTGQLVARFGQVQIVIVGAIILAISAMLTPISNQMPMLIIALFLLGLGWNFCFIAGSSLLSGALASLERGRAQGAAETLVSLAAGAGSLSTGFVFAGAGIVAVSAIGLAFSLALFAGTTWWTKQTVPVPTGD